ncbi:hypothetical protein DPMN_152640 [Dreissena polymorpha]|uniref:Uncharacterized protein n=1 Tax=Dreissena polymorpha TaxID=45954 RepID=A0A9D4FJ94_DREPO|nr:hypothetical protein DPMN_152640 [Dreissena polymorpha]
MTSFNALMECSQNTIINRPSGHCKFGGHCNRDFECECPAQTGYWKKLRATFVSFWNLNI